MISGISQYRKTNTAWTHIEGIPSPTKKRERAHKSLNSQKQESYQVLESGGSR